jgi:DNA helicase-2/ATP-dependent DNA helicase PcrA
LLLENNFLDFGDLIAYCLKLFQKRPAVLEEYRKKFKYILVDEFQDTNWAQYELVKMLAGPHKNLTVTADDDQSIYKFRGASYNNIIQFRKDFPEAKEISLIKNYRSAQNILNLSYKFIKANDPDRLEYVSGLNKKLEAVREKEGIIEHLHFRSLEEESGGVANKIIEILKKDKEASLSDFAILVRANGSAGPFIRALERADIPYQFLASRGLYAKPVILDIVSYFKVLDNYHEGSAFFRILNLPFLKIPAEEIMKITHYGRLKAKSIYETLQELPLLSGISRQTTDKINFLLGIIKKHTNLVRENNVSEVLIGFLKDSGYLKYLSKKEAGAELDLISQFYKKIKKFEDSVLEPTLRNFLEEINMEVESGEEGKLEFDPEAGPDIVRIMTVHSSKGLEFKYVFLVNMVDKRFPVIGRREQIEIPKELIKEIIPKEDVHLQEERRLCYVAMTRAKKGLFFTSADDYGGARKKKLSRFLIEMDFGREKDKLKYESRRGRDKQGQNVKGIIVGRAEGGEIKKKRQKIILPPHFSFSQLAAFKKCPLQYKFAHILKIPVKGKAIFSFGKTIHSVLYEFVKLFIEGKNTSQKELFSVKSEALKKDKKENFIGFEELLKIYERKWVDEWYEDKIQKEKYYKLGRKILKDFHGKFLKEPPDILKINGKPALELSFKLKLGDYMLFGRIDRIDKLEKGVRIIDYKTGSFKEKLASENKEQLLIYQIAVEKVFGIEPAELSYYYLEEGKAASFLGSQKEKEKRIEAILAEIEEIKKSSFAPAPGWQCKFCDFKDICDYAKS